MPIVQIQVSPPGVTQQQKQQLISGVTNLLKEVLEKDPKLTHIIIQEVATDDWGYDGQPVSQIFNHK